ncbi:MAG: hypothetical protein QM532_04270 [Cyanobium sp. MAG06]|nr:hypothetical protein [Cyanobium sp. MAG06]
MIRQYLEKGKVHDTIQETDIIKINESINHRPRKKLNYLSPYEVYVLGKDPKKDGYSRFR